MKNKELLKKIGICIMGVIVVAGVMLFIFKDNTSVPTNNDFVVEEVSTEEVGAIVGGLIEDEVKFNEVKMPTVEESTEEIVEETEEESDTLPGITVIEESTEEETVKESTEEFVEETEVAEREIMALDKTMYAQKDCNVRADAGTENEKVGSLGKNEEVKVTGETKADDGSTWYEIDLGNGEKGYVSGSLVGDNKVQESSVHNNSGSSNTNQGSGINNTDSGVVSSQQQYFDQLEAMGIKNMGSGIGLTTDCGGSGNME